MSTFWKTKRKKGAKSKLAARCHYYWSLIVRAKQPMCQRCKVRPTKNAHHVITRGHGPKPWWYQIEYGCGLCIDCHSNWAHSTDVDRQISFRDDFLIPWIESRGLNYESMKMIARSPGSMKEYQLQAIKEQLQRDWKGSEYAKQRKANSV